MAVAYSQNGVIVSPRNISLVAYSPSQSYTLIIDKDGYIGDKQPAGGNTYFAYIDPRADFSQIGLGQVTTIIPEIGEAVIGDKTYKTTKIGNQTWLAENLDLQWEGLAIGGSGQPSDVHGWYYDNDELTYGWNGYKCGLLYNWYAVEYLRQNISTLTPGYHIPVKSDYQTLVSYIGPNSGIKLAARDVSFAPNWFGADLYGFNALPAGVYGIYVGAWQARFGALAEYTKLWYYDSSRPFDVNIFGDMSSSEVSYTDELSWCARPIRLIKDS